MSLYNVLNNAYLLRWTFFCEEALHAIRTNIPMLEKTAICFQEKPFEGFTGSVGSGDGIELTGGAITGDGGVLAGSTLTPGGVMFAG